MAQLSLEGILGLIAHFITNLGYMADGVRLSRLKGVYFWNAEKKKATHNHESLSKNEAD
ncbi:hypothetical protein VIBNISFn118_500035 [Vibrio nigripulchritudo SFn118]|nr:hypothetical protein VIBNISFn118_500035 [Vibrio nigripulchritudo SFn118]